MDKVWQNDHYTKEQLQEIVYRAAFFHVVSRASAAHGWVSYGAFFWMVMLFWGMARLSKRELCSAKRKWAFSLESLDGVIKKMKGAW